MKPPLTIYIYILYLNINITSLPGSFLENYMGYPTESPFLSMLACPKGNILMPAESKDLWATRRILEQAGRALSFQTVGAIQKAFVMAAQTLSLSRSPSQLMSTTIAPQIVYILEIKPDWNPEPSTDLYACSTRSKVLLPCLWAKDP